MKKVDRSFSMSLSLLHLLSSREANRVEMLFLCKIVKKKNLTIIFTDIKCNFVADINHVGSMFIDFIIWFSMC